MVPLDRGHHGPGALRHSHRRQNSRQNATHASTCVRSEQARETQTSVRSAAINAQRSMEQSLVPRAYLVRQAADASVQVAKGNGTYIVAGCPETSDAGQQSAYCMRPRDTVPLGCELAATYRCTWVRGGASSRARAAGRKTQTRTMTRMRDGARLEAQAEVHPGRECPVSAVTRAVAATPMGTPRLRRGPCPSQLSPAALEGNTSADQTVRGPRSECAR